MSRHIPVRQVWEFEAAYCRDPKPWLHQALNLRGNLEALLLYDNQVFECVFEKKNQPPLPAFWSAGVERMLMGFSLENLVKALILQDPNKADQAFKKEGNLHWALPSHNLHKLFAEAGTDFDEEELIFLELWTTCSTWSGRYPLPKNENQLPRQRKPAASSEALLRRRSREIKKAISSGTSLQLEQFDLLHSGVGTEEIKVYRSLFDRLRECVEKKSAN
jgi:hypothetical protein